jgi:hypothetical protein
VGFFKFRADFLAEWISQARAQDAKTHSEAPTIGAVASLLAMDRTTLIAALKPLRRPSLIKVTTDHDDQRARLLQLT